VTTPGGGQEEVEEGYRFGRFRLLPQARQLLAGDRPVPLGSRALDQLVALVEAQGAVLSKDALPTRIWPGTVVEENKLQVQVAALRKALGEDAATMVKTVPGRGYYLADGMTEGMIMALSQDRWCCPSTAGSA
jgi:DNA-binding winged helix-turn-helix (wHTH) protein